MSDKEIFANMLEPIVSNILDYVNTEVIKATENKALIDLAVKAGSKDNKSQIGFKILAIVMSNMLNVHFNSNSTLTELEQFMDFILKCTIAMFTDKEKVTLGEVE